MQQHVVGLDDLLDLRRGHAGERDAVVVAEIDHRVAMHVGGDELLQFLHGLRVGEVVELDRVGLRIEVDDGVGADIGFEYEGVVARAADRNGRVGGIRCWRIGDERATIPSDAKLNVPLKLSNVKLAA
jgi:hypothetical protein